MAYTSPALQQLNALATLSPWVIAMRSWEILNAAPARRQREARRMVQEKQAASLDAMFAMGQAFWQAQWQSWAQWTTAAFMQRPGASMDPMRVWLESAQFADRIVSSGLRPATRRVRGNVRRLSRKY